MTIGRLLQLIGMAELFAALFVGIRYQSMGREMTLFIIGIAIFTIGWMLDRRR